MSQTAAASSITTSKKPRTTPPLRAAHTPASFNISRAWESLPHYQPQSPAPTPPATPPPLRTPTSPLPDQPKPTPLTPQPAPVTPPPLTTPTPTTPPPQARPPAQPAPSAPSQTQLPRETPPQPSAPPEALKTPPPAPASPLPATVRNAQQAAPLAAPETPRPPAEKAFSKPGFPQPETTPPPSPRPAPVDSARPAGDTAPVRDSRPVPPAKTADIPPARPLAAPASPASPTLPPPPKPVPLADEARHGLDGQVKNLEEQARHRLIGIIEQRMKERNRANPRSMRDPHPGFSRQEDIARLQNLKNGGPLDTQDVNEIHRTDRAFFDQFHSARTALTGDDKARQSLAAEEKQQQAAEQDQLIFDQWPKAWTRDHEKRVAELPVENLPAYIRQQAEVIQQQKTALEGQGTALKQEDEALTKTLEEMQGRNRELLRRDGHVPPETGTGAWHPEIIDEVEAFQQKASKLQDRFLEYQEQHGRITQELQRRIAPIQQAQARLEQTQKESHSRSLESMRFQGLPGADLAASDMDAQATAQQAALQKLQEEHPDGIPPEKLQAFQQQAAAGQMQTMQRFQQRMMAAQAAYQGIQSRLAEDPSLHATMGDLYVAAREKLATATGITTEQARNLLQDASLQDWGTYVHGETNPGMFSSDQRETRTLSNGALIVHPRLHGDAQAYVDAVNRSTASPEAKRVALDMQPEVRRQWASQMAETLVTEQDIPGLPSFNQWREEKVRQDQNARGVLGFTKLDLPDMALRYMEEMKQRPGWQKYADTFTRRLIAAGGNVGASVLSLTAMALKYSPHSQLIQQATGVDLSQITADAAASWSRSNNAISSSVGMKGGLDSWGLQATAILADAIPQLGSSVLGGSALKGLQLSKWLSTAAIGGSQSAGQTFTSMYTDLRDQGKTHEEAFKTTLPAAVSAGAATAVLGVIVDKVGKTGLNNLGQSLQDPTIKKAVTDLWKQQFKNLAGKTATAGADTAKEMVEETADSLINEVIQAVAKNPNAKLDEVIAGVIRQTPEILTAVVEMGALTKGSGGRPPKGHGTPPALPGITTPTLPAPLAVPTVPGQPPNVPSPPHPAPAPVAVTAPAPVTAPVATVPQPVTSQNNVQPPPAPSPQGEGLAKPPLQGEGLAKSPLQGEGLAKSPLQQQTDTPRQDTSQNDVTPAPPQLPPGEAPARSPHQGEGLAKPPLQQQPDTPQPATSQNDVTHTPAQYPQGDAPARSPLQGEGLAKSPLQQQPDTSRQDTSQNDVTLVPAQSPQGDAAVRSPLQQQQDTPRHDTSPTDVNHRNPQTTTNHRTTTPPIWQGRAARGESAAILGRNPDGTFQVLLDGQEKTFTEPNLAGMLDMRKGPLHAMLGQATQQHLARPRPPTTTPPIWQGRGLRGDPVSILTRNPDGTFQVLIDGQERTRTEPDIAQMLNLHKAPLHEMLGQATKGRLDSQVNKIDNAAASQFNARRGDRTNIAVPGGLPHGQTGEFDRSVLYDQPVADLFGSLQKAAQILSAADGRQLRRPSAVGTNQRNETAPAATFEADGTIGIAGNPRLWAEGLLQDNNGNLSLALKQAKATVTEETWHVAQLVGMRNDWVKAGKPGSFVDWVHDRSNEIMESIGDAAARATPADAAKIKQALFATWELYFAQEGHGQTPDSVFRQLTSPVQRGRLVTRGTFLAEFTRQFQQAGVRGQTTETAGLLGRLRTWVQQALDGLKQAYAMARGGAMGKPLKDLMDRTEAVLQGREVALPIQPGLRSGPGDAFLGASHSTESNLSHSNNNVPMPLKSWLDDNLDLLNEARSMHESAPEWQGINPETTKIFYRSRPEVDAIRAQPGESGGHHPHGLALGGPRGQKLTLTGETRTKKNPLHSKATAIQRKIINHIKKKL